MAEFKDKLIDTLETGFRIVLEWAHNNDQELGETIRTLHVVCMISLVVLYLVSRLIYPVLWFQCVYFGIVFVIWIQHIVFHSCLVTHVENKLIGTDSHAAVDRILRLLRIQPQPEIRWGFTLFASSGMTFVLFIELLSQGTIQLRNHFKASPWI